MKVEQPSQALEHVRTATGLDPDQSAWRIEQAEILRDLGRTEEALPELRTALATQPENWQARKALGLTYEVMGEYALAGQTFSRLPQGLDAESKLHAGRILVRSVSEGGPGDLKTATALLVGALEAGLEQASIWYWLAHSYEQAHLIPQAVEAYKAFLNQIEDDHPQKLEALLGFARASSEADQLEEAIEILEDGRQSFPASHELLYTLSRAYLSADQPEEAFHSAKQAVELAPSSISALEVLREAAIENGKPDEALASQQAILKVRPQDPNAHLKMAQLYAELSEPVPARSHLAHAIWHSRSEGGDLASLAPAAEKISGSKLAQNLLKRAAVLNPGNPEILESLARHSEAVRDFETAQASWLEISKHARHDPQPLQRAAQALTKLGRRTAALGLQQRALEIAPDAPQHLALAHALAAAGDSPASLDHYLEAARLAPDNFQTMISAAKGISELGTVEQAQEVLQAAVGHGMEAEQAALVQAEFALASGDARAAAKLLSDLPLQNSNNPSPASLKIRADRSQGRIAEAQAALSEVLASPVGSSAEISEVIKAALSVHAWEAAIVCLEQGFEAFELDGQMVFLAEGLAHRYRDLEWLFRITGNAEGHTPNADEAGLLKLLDRAREFNHDLEPVHSAILDLWGALQSGSIGTDEYHRIHALPRSVRSNLTEAGIIGLLKANRPARAVELMNAAGNDPTGSQVITILRAISETMLGHYHTAVKILEGVTQDALFQPLALYLQASALRKAGEDQAYMTKLNAALAVWPEEHRWHFELAEAYLAIDHFDAAIPHLQQAVEQSPQDGQYLVELARAFRSVGQLEDAEAMYAASLQLSPKSAQIWKEAGDVALSIGNVEGAEKWLERACTLAPSDAGCLIQSARAALARGDHKSAMKRAQAAYRLEPEQPSVLAGLAEILATDGKLEKAIQMYDNALKTADGDLKIKLARATLLAKSGRAREAVQELRTIVARTPEDDLAWSALAQAERDADELEQALEAANQALKLSPRNIGHMQLVGVICRESGQLDRALSTLTEAAKYAHNDSRLARELGKVYEARREAHLALESYKLAIELDPMDFDSLMHAGLILKNIKLYDQAGALFERGVQINPLDPQALQQLATIRALQLIHGNNAEAEAVPTS
jgi:tetratricopeptide (TPR) repeat protein